MATHVHGKVLPDSPCLIWHLHLPPFNLLSQSFLKGNILCVSSATFIGLGGEIKQQKSIKFQLMLKEKSF